MNFKKLFSGLFLLLISIKSSTTVYATHRSTPKDFVKIKLVGAYDIGTKSELDLSLTNVKISIQAFTNSFIINFDNVRGASKYEIKYATSPSGKDWKIITSAFTRIEITKLNPNQVYYFQGRILNQSIWSPWSIIQSSNTASFVAKVVSYNVLSAIHDNVFPENVWESRKKAMVNLIKNPSNEPDILGLQEVMDSTQLYYLKNAFKRIYNVHISKRKISPRAIFWNKNKYDLVAFDDDIDLNKDLIAGNSARFISCIKLKERSTNKEFLVFNVHLPSSYSGDKELQRNSLATVLSKTAIEMASALGDVPIVVLGDFNSLPSSRKTDGVTAPMIMISSGFADVFNEAIDRKFSQYATHDRITTGISSSNPTILGQPKRIDYIFTYPLHRIAVSEYKIVADFEKSSGSVLRTPIPSDHRPVSSVLHFFY
jgi:endonuclease/exonuclease/phosphatase family metal-dependent hydrolase